MNTKVLKTFLTICRVGSITKAAQLLYISQPALSHFISKAEEELGAKIFNRGTTPLTLTQAGEKYVKTARMILGLQESLKQEIENLKDCRSGEITLGLSDMRATVLLPFVLPEFRRLYPNVAIRTVESSSKEVENNVRNGVVEIGIIPLYDYGQDLSASVLYDEELLLVSASEVPSHHGATRNWVSLGDMTGKDFILLHRPNRIRRAVDAMFIEHGVKPKSIFESCNNMTVYMMAASGLGLAIVPDSVVRIMNPMPIPRVYSIGKGGFHWNIGAIWREDMVLSGAHTQLIRLLKNRYV